MKTVLTLIDQLGERANRTDLWIICTLVSFVFAIARWDTELLIWVMGFMFADLGIEKVSDVQKVKMYAENIREDQSGSRSTDISSGNDNPSMDSHKPITK